MLAPYQGMFLPPGVGTDAFTTESDLTNIIYGPSYMARFVTYAQILGSARDAGNTGNTTVLRNGLIMGIVTASGKWKQFDSAAADGSQFARGILVTMGLNTQFNNADQDRFLATILIGGVMVNPSGLCLASTAGYGLARTGVGLTVRKHLFYGLPMSDDAMGDLVLPLSGR